MVVRQVAVAASGRIRLRRYGIGLDAMKLSPSGREHRQRDAHSVRLHATAVRRPRELLNRQQRRDLGIVFGELKTLERQQAGSGPTGSTPALGAIAPLGPTKETIEGVGGDTMEGGEAGSTNASAPRSNRNAAPASDSTST